MVCPAQRSSLEVSLQEGEVFALHHGGGGFAPNWAYRVSELAVMPGVCSAAGSFAGAGGRPCAPSCCYHLPATRKEGRGRDPGRKESFVEAPSGLYRH